MSTAFKVDKSLAFRQQASPPANPLEGEIYNDTVQGLLQYKGGSWVGLGSGGAVRSILIAGGDFTVPYTNGDPIIYDTVYVDTHNGYNVTTGEYEIPYDGIYRLCASAGGDFTNDGNSFWVVNGIALDGGLSINRGGGINGASNRLAFLNQGDLVTYTNTAPASTSTNEYNHLSIEGISADIALNSSSQIMSEWIEFPVTGSWDNTDYLGVYRRVGDSMEMQVYLVGTGSPTVTPLNIDLPPGLEMDLDKLPGAFAGNGPNLGQGSVAAANPFNLTLLLNSSTSISPWYVSTVDSQMTQVSPAGNPITFTTGSELWIKTSPIPIQGWSAAAAPIASPRSEVVLMGGNGKGSVYTDVRRYQYIVSEMGDALQLTQDADEGDSITVLESGVYAVTASDRSTSGGFSAYIMINNATSTYELDGSDLVGIFEGPSAGYTASISVTRYFPAGTIIRVRSGAALEDYGTTYLASFSVCKVVN